MSHISIIDNRVIVHTSGKKAYHPNVAIATRNLQQCLEFASRMAYGDGYHQEKAFGGEYTRDAGDIFKNTLQGKVAEVGIWAYLYRIGLMPDNPPDFDVWGKGHWEDCDLTLKSGKYKISVKSTKYFGNLLLLECDRYNANGFYLEAVNGVPLKHDFIFLVRVKGVESASPTDYHNLSSLSCEVTGFITYKQFAQAIAERKIIAKGSVVGIPMIVDNYYFCATELNNPVNIVDFFTL